MDKKLQKKQTAFKEVCYSADKQKKLRELLEKNILGIQQFHILHEKFCKERFDLICNSCKYKLHWMVGATSDKCRYCNQCIVPEDFTITYSYWGAFWFPSHKHCHVVGSKQEAYECQKIDADCNDCKFFARGLTQPDVSYGLCKKYDIYTAACSNFSSGLECFQHRKDKQ